MKTQGKQSPDSPPQQTANPSEPGIGGAPGLLAGMLTEGSNSSLGGLTLPSTAHWPKIEVETCSDTESTLQLAIHAGLTWFTGHFPGQPVLPGVVQTHWAGLLAQALFTRDSGLQFSRLQKIKFNSVVTPGQHLQLKLTWHAERQQCAFRYLGCDDKAVSSGTLCFNRMANP